jgi:hypothetical protein
MTLHFTTASNSHYEIDGDRVRRVRRVPELRFSDENTLRGDNEWAELLAHLGLEVGRPAVMRIILPGRENPTLRTTSPIERIWHDDKENAA